MGVSRALFAGCCTLQWLDVFGEYPFRKMETRKKKESGEAEEKRGGGLDGKEIFYFPFFRSTQMSST